MINWSDTRSLLSVLLLLGGLIAPPVAADWPPPTYQAIYDLYMDGKPRAETRVRFTLEGNTWGFENAAEGKKGLAGFLGAETSEAASGTIEDGSIRSSRFSHRYRISFKKDRWEAEFDWSAGKVRTTHDDTVREFPLQAGMVDPLSLTLEMQRRLTLGQDEWEISVVEEDEIDPQRFRALPPVRQQTALGCFEVVEVQRVRDNSKRYSSVWLAPEFHFITVRMVHGKRDANEFELRLRELSIAGAPLPTGIQCPNPEEP
jgi:hypothetical protein